MLNYVKLTILSENRVSDLIPHIEQGQPISVETEYNVIHIDTAQTDVLLSNVRNLNMHLLRTGIK